MLRIDQEANMQRICLMVLMLLSFLTTSYINVYSETIIKPIEEALITRNWVEVENLLKSINRSTDKDTLEYQISRVKYFLETYDKALSEKEPKKSLALYDTAVNRYWVPLTKNPLVFSQDFVDYLNDVNNKIDTAQNHITKQLNEEKSIEQEKAKAQEQQKQEEKKDFSTKYDNSDLNKVTVFVMSGGNEYHVKGCQILGSARIQIKLGNAILKNYVPCEECNPPAVYDNGELVTKDYLVEKVIKDTGEFVIDTGSLWIELYKIYEKNHK